jgi:hypothetical protein
MSEHIYDAITQERLEGDREDKRLEAMIGVLVMKLAKKEVITMDEATDIMAAEDLFKEINKVPK